MALLTDEMRDERRVITGSGSDMRNPLALAKG
jgi:hypothetical protein